MKKEKTMNCRESSQFFYCCLHNPEGVPSEVAAHIEHCADCRGQVDRLRGHLLASETQPQQNSLVRKHLRLHARLLDQWVGCAQVRPFLPALLIPEMKISVPTPVTAHLEHCSQCRTHLTEIQSLGLSPEQLIAAGTYMSGPDQTVNLPDNARSVLDSVLQAENSDLETRMDAIAAGIKVRHRNSAPVSRSRSVRYWLTGGIAAAAVLLIVTLLPTAAIGNLENVNRAVKSVSEVHLQRYSDSGDLIQEIWISKSLGYKIYRQPEKTFIKNIRSCRIVQVTPDSAPVYLSQEPREDDSYARLLPFDQLKDLPPQFEWNFVEESVLDGRRVLIYELKWEHAGAALTVFKKWRAALDPETFLPCQIEWFEKMQGEDDYTLVTRSKVDYPSKARFLEKLEQENFYRFLTDDHME
jgi:hypothetical protein